MNAEPPKRKGIHWYHRLIYRLFIYWWNPIYQKYPELVVPISEELFEFALERLGPDKYTECAAVWEKVKEDRENRTDETKDDELNDN